MNYIDHVDCRVLNTDVLKEMVKKLGYNDGFFFCIHYKEPYCSLDFGLRTLKCDADLLGVFANVRQGANMIDMYVEHGMSTILENTSEGLVGACKAIVPASFTINNQNLSMNEDEEESEGSDPDYEYVEEDNLVYEIEVDMQRFRANVDFTREELDGSSDGDHDDDRSEEGHVPVDLEDFESGSDENSTLRDKVARKIRRRNKSASKGPNDLPFYIGQLIDDKKKMNQMVKDYALKARRDVFILKNELLSYRVVCFGSNPPLLGPVKRKGEEGQNSKCTKVGQKYKHLKRHTKPTCPWAVHISRNTNKDKWCVKTIHNQHNCLTTRAVSLYTMSSIAREIQPMIESNPDMPIQAIQSQLLRKHQLEISLHKVFRAKRIATTKIYGDYQEQYGLLRSYYDELLKANPGSTI
ncbi:hypothetical protein HanRHA438_Chr08g0358501 [Helianthus annuus]|nr:hypothetical protein HanRHA438_Chr08g0358501 [Helianthus annuus]